MSPRAISLDRVSAGYFLALLFLLVIATTLAQASGPPYKPASQEQMEKRVIDKSSRVSPHL